MDKRNTTNNDGSTRASRLSAQDLARYQAELIWMHNRTVREIKEAQEKDAREEELRAKQSSQETGK
ncbi:hypothetical protein BDW60DRAFT_207243 [Aspergillus nidulans var. acristatus]